MKTNLLKKIGLFVLCALLFTACKKQEPIPGKPPVELKNYKYTITVHDIVEANHQIDIYINAIGEPDNYSVWKINNIADQNAFKPNASNVYFDYQDFVANNGTFVIETTRPIEGTGITLYARANTNYGIPSKDFVFSYKLEVNNVLKLNVERVTLKGHFVDFEDSHYTF